MAIRKTEFDDVLKVAVDMREEDKAEVLASNGHSPLYALLEGYRRSTVMLTVTAMGKPVAIFGLVPDTLLGHTATVWMLTANGMDDIKYEFAKHSKAVINWLLGHYPCIYNYVDARYTTSVMWLAWCGAAVFKPGPYGMNGEPFHFFRFVKGGG